MPAAGFTSPSARLKLRLDPAAERAIREGHPWVFADRVRACNRPGTAGELAVAYDRKNRFLAIGLYDPDGPIALRVLHVGQPVELTEEWWKERLARPLAERARQLGPDTDGYRCVNGESDGWPGLVIDRYANIIVMKLYTAAWLPHLERCLRLVAGSIHPASIVLRLSRNCRAAAATAGHADGTTLHGERITEPVVFHEAGLRFEADLVNGQKTGFFLDQRENRCAVAKLAEGTDVLNVFSHAGGFSVHAAAAGARSATDVDLSRHALAAAQRNFALNLGLRTVAACRHETIQADAFEWLEQRGDHGFDVVVIDPPSLAMRAADKAAALTAYRKLATSGWRRVRPGGTLVAASCSAHVPAPEFFQLVRNALPAGASEFMTTLHPTDHPARIPEAHYLKAIFLRKSRQLKMDKKPPPLRNGSRAT